jgi:DNA-binding transcriptional LysR family regulator
MVWGVDLIAQHIGRPTWGHMLIAFNRYTPLTWFVFDPLSLEYFTVVAREHSMNRAARTLHASQPTVFRRIQKLEKEVGTKLFERRTTGVALTRGGRALARYVDEMRRLADEARQVVRQVSSGAKKSVRVGFYLPAATVLVQLLRLLHTAHPEVELEPMEGTQAHVLEALRKAEIDLALPGYVKREFLLEFEGLRVPGPALNYVLPDSHHFARRKRLHLAELKDEKFVSLDRHEFPGYDILLLEQCRLAGFVPQISVYANTWSEAIAYVIAGRGITLAPKAAIALPLAAAITIIDAKANLEWYAFWSASNGNPLLRLVIQLLLDAPPPGWEAVKRGLPALGTSKIRQTAKSPR